MRKCNSVTTDLRREKTKWKRRTLNVGQISNQNKGDMMKIEMKHHPGVTVL